MCLDFCALCGATDVDCLEQHHFIPKVEGGLRAACSLLDGRPFVKSVEPDAEAA